MNARILDLLALIVVAAGLWYFWAKWRANNQWAEQDKLTTPQWWESSVLRDEYIAQGLSLFHWCSPALLEQRLEEGHEIVHELDKKRKTRYRIVNKNGQVLLAKKVG